MTAGNGLLRGAAWTAGMKIVVAGVSFAFFAIVARHWGATRLGELSLVYTCYIIAQQLPLLGLHYPLMRDIAQRPADAASLIRAVAAVGFVCASLLWLILSFGVSAAYAENLRTPFALVGLSLLPGVIVAIAETVLVAREQLARVAQISMAETLIRTIVWLMVVFSGGGLVTLCALLVAGRVIAAGVYLLRVDDLGECLRCTRTTRGELSTQLRSAPPFFSILVLTACINRLDFLWVSRVSGTTALGLYSTPYRIYEGLLMLPQSLSVALSPRLARDFAPYAVQHATGSVTDRLLPDDPMRDKRGREIPLPEHEALVRLLCRAAVLLGAPCALLLAVIAKPLITLIFGVAYVSAAPVLVWLAGVPVLAAIDQCLGIVLLSTHRQRADLGVLCASSAFYAAALFVLVPRYGATGAAAATCLTAVVQVCVRYATVRILVRIRSLIGVIWRPIGATALTAAALIAMPVRSVAVQILTLALAYVVAAFLLRAITMDEIRGWVAWVRLSRRRSLAPATAAS